MTTKSERKNQLMPNGTPRWIRCYDNGGKTWDRYTVVYTKKAFNTGRARWFLYVGMSGNPFSAQGYCIHGESEWTPLDRPTYGHLGKRIEFDTLPLDCQEVVLIDYKDLWNIE
jgi:hypothetical protein